MSLRPASAGDATAIADLQTRRWQDAYAGQLDARFLAETLPGTLADYWGKAFDGRDPRDVVLLAERADRLDGFVALGRAAADPGLAFIDHVHVDPALRRQGLGRRLMAAAARVAEDQGRGAVYLMVLSSNAAALAFYRRLGGRVGAAIPDRVFGLDVTARRVEWPDIADLIAACR